MSENSAKKLTIQEAHDRIVDCEDVDTIMKSLLTYPDLAACKCCWFDQRTTKVYPIYIVVTQGADLGTVKKVYEMCPECLDQGVEKFSILKMLCRGGSKPSVLLYLVKQCPDLLALNRVDATSIFKSLLVDRHYADKELPSLKKVLETLVSGSRGACTFKILQQACEVCEQLSNATAHRIAWNIPTETIRNLQAGQLQDDTTDTADENYTVVSNSFMRALALVLPRVRHLALPRRLVLVEPTDEVCASLLNQIATKGVNLERLDLNLPPPPSEREAFQPFWSLLATTSVPSVRVDCSENLSYHEDRGWLKGMMRAITKRTIPMASLELRRFRFVGTPDQDLVSLLVSPNGARKLIVDDCKFEEGTGDLLPFRPTSDKGTPVPSLKEFCLRHGLMPSAALPALPVLSRLQTLKKMQIPTSGNGTDMEAILTLINENKQFESLSLSYFPATHLRGLLDILREDNHSLQCLEVDVFGREAAEGCEAGLAELLDLLQTSNTTLRKCSIETSGTKRFWERLALRKKAQYYLQLNSVGRRQARESSSKTTLVELLTHLEHNFAKANPTKQLDDEELEVRKWMMECMREWMERVASESEKRIDGLRYGLLREKPHVWASEIEDRQAVRPKKRRKV